MVRTLFTVAMSVLIGAGVAIALGTHAVQVAGLPLPWLCAALAFVIQWIAFIPAWLKHTEHFYDLAGSLTYVSVIALAVLGAQTQDPRALIVALLVLVLGYMTIELEIFRDGAKMTGFFVAIARVNNHLKNMARSMTKVGESVGASVRLTELLAEPVDVVERREARDSPFARQAHDGGPRVRVFQGVVVGRVDAVVQIAEREDDRLA